MTGGTILKSRLVARIPLSALGALCAKAVFSLSSFMIQALAGRQLGASGFGMFALLFGTILMATAVTSGLLGDTFIVLNRHDQHIRAALAWLTILLTCLLSLLGFVLALLRLPFVTALLFAFAMATYILADLARRLLAVSLRFWSLLIADSVALAAIVLYFGISYAAQTLQLDHFLTAIVINQIIATCVVLALAAPTERTRPQRRWGDWRAVLRYGAWRAGQAFIRPTMLSAARWLVVVAAGTAAVGSLEAARVFVAPAMLFVEGIGAYLFNRYALDKLRSSDGLLLRADRTAVALFISSVLVGGLAGALLEPFGHILTGGHYQLSLVAVLGWSCFTASYAASLPYAHLAAVRQKQRPLVYVAMLSSLVSLVLVTVALILCGLPAAWVPWLLSAGNLLGGLLCRQVLLKPIQRESEISL